MNKIKNILKSREEYLLRLKKEKEQALKNVPEGVLRICPHGKRAQYYWRKDAKDLSGTYIRDKDISLAQKLAQKDYDKKILASIEKELNALRKYQANSPDTYVEQVYETLHKERQKLIIPIIDTDEQYIQKWENITYHGKEIGENTPEIYTAKGERVRSKSEVIIADILGSEGIPYKYECPLKLKGWGTVYPDFTVLNVAGRKELYWEHFGMMDDMDYVEKALHKITLYEQNEIFPGDKLILTYETQKNPINQKNIRRIIQHCFWKNIN